MRTGLSIVVGLALFAPAPARANETAIFVAKFLGGHLAGKALDKIWDLFDSAPNPDERVKELSIQLSAYEASLREVDAKLADQIAQLRKELSTKTTPAQVRAIVLETLGELDSRIAKLEANTGRLENRQDKIEQRVKDIEQLFGHLPTVPPSPLMTSTVEAGKPQAHPLTLEWITLLIRSEQSRQNLEELRRTRAETSKLVQDAVERDKAILAETARLHLRVKQDLARRVADRQELLREFKPGAPEVRKFDEEMASVTWLTAVTRPIPAGVHAGRLGVPPALFGPEASEIVLAFKLAKADTSQIADLYRRQWLAQAARDPFLGVRPERAKLTAPMNELGAEVVELALRGFDLGRRVQTVDAQLTAALKEFSAESERVKGLRGEQANCFAAVRKMDQQFSELLRRGCELYVEAIALERPTNARMKAFRDSVLLPAAAWCEALRSSGDGIDPQTWQRVAGLSAPRLTLKGHTNSAICVAFSPDGRTIASGAGDKTVKLWDARTGQELRTLSGHAHSVMKVCFSPDGRTIASASGDRTVKLWDAQTGRELRTLTGHTDYLSCLAVSPDGKTIAGGGGDKTVKLWDAQTGQELRTLTGHTNTVQGVAFSPDGKTIATASFDNTLKLWDATTGGEIRTLKGHTSFVYCVAFSPDGKTLATGGLDHALKLWDARTGQELYSRKSHTQWLTGVAFSRDGKILVSGSADDTLKLWDAQTGHEFHTITGHAERVYGVAFSPDGKTLASASMDNTLNLWPFEEIVTRLSKW